ncbi:hypothetical protein MTO96_017044 [Rhipicephalus appendiculatus]
MSALSLKPCSAITFSEVISRQFAWRAGRVPCQVTSQARASAALHRQAIEDRVEKGGHIWSAAVRRALGRLRTYAATYCAVDVVPADRHIGANGRDGSPGSYA